MDTYENRPAGDRHGEDKFCPQCGAHIPIGDRFCRSCGAKLADEPSTKARRNGHKKGWIPVAAIIVLILAVVMLSQGLVVRAQLWRTSNLFRYCVQRCGGPV